MAQSLLFTFSLHWFRRIFGVTTLDVVRASTFFAEILGDLGKAPSIVVPVVGGHSGVTASLSDRPIMNWELTCYLIDRATTLAVVPPAPLWLCPGCSRAADESHPVRW